MSPKEVRFGDIDLSARFKPALRGAPGTVQQKAAGQAQAADISGTWQSSIGLVYEITQTGSTFSWHVASVNQRAEGTIDGNSVKASWRGLLRRDSATGKVILDASGRAVRIEWSNGVVFRR